MEANGKENRVDLNRRTFLKQAGPALAVAGVAAHMASGVALGQENRIDLLRGQTALTRSMLKADSALCRIGKGISGGVLDEVVAGAKDLQTVLQAIAKANIGQSSRHQREWESRSLDAASNAATIGEMAEAAMQRGEKEIPSEVVELYAVAIRETNNCHSRFRTGI